MFKHIIGSIVVALPLAWGTLQAADPKPVSADTLESWLERYGTAWETRDATAAGRLFTPDAIYQEMPFDEPKSGRAGIEEYWRTVTKDQREIHFKAQVIAVSGNTGVAHWSAEFKAASNGAKVMLDGVFVLDFADSGQVAKLREWWHVKS